MHPTITEKVKTTQAAIAQQDETRKQMKLIEEDNIYLKDEIKRYRSNIELSVHAKEWIKPMNMSTYLLSDNSAE